jgi:hypothetical protein
MKRATLFVVFLLAVTSVALYAQAEGGEPFVKSVPIMRILSHPLGYKILYLKSSMEVGEFYVPFSWFKAGYKAEIVFGGYSSYPYFSIFYKGGKFSFIRIYAQEDIRDVTWGRLSPRVGDEANFQVDELDLEF